ncbi:MAG: thiamine-monophosphate kinase [Promethearchaeota archaeon]
MKKLDSLGEAQLIDIIMEIIYTRTGKQLIRDDCFYFNDTYSLGSNKIDDRIIVLNSDMFVSTTDAPPQMNPYMMGTKSIIMNISDMIVKAVEPKAIIISLGLPKDYKINKFKQLIEGIVDCCKKFNLDYIGGDINETKEVIINPTILGVENKSKIIHREGISIGNILVANGKFGLTGVGLDILILKKGCLSEYPKYKKSIQSVLNPVISSKEAFILAEYNIATASIDSSDGLERSLKELMVSNPGIGFEIDFNENLVEAEALNYAKEYDIPIEKLLFYAGEEYIHLFTIPEEKLEQAIKLMELNKLCLNVVGKVTSTEKIMFLKKKKKIQIKSGGYEHFKEFNIK